MPLTLNNKMVVKTTEHRDALRTSDSVQVKRVRDCSEGYFCAFDSEQQDGSQDNRTQGCTMHF